MKKKKIQFIPTAVFEGLLAETILYLEELHNSIRKKGYRELEIRDIGKDHTSLYIFGIK